MIFQYPKFGSGSVQTDCVSAETGSNPRPVDAPPLPTPSTFSAFIGFEWTQSLKGNNLHRTVVFRDGADRVKGTHPFSEFDSTDPVALWRRTSQRHRRREGPALPTC
jgi:hypothetical protein